MKVALKIVQDNVYAAYEVTDDSREFVGYFYGELSRVMNDIEIRFDKKIEFQSLPFQGWY